jgi:hypothetical protein
MINSLSKIIFFALCVLLGGLMCFDVISTTLILSLGGVELNPIMAFVVGNPLLHLGLKIFVAGVFVWIAAIGQKKVKGAGYALLCAPVLFYVVVAVNNFSVLAGLL